MTNKNLDDVKILEMYNDGVVMTVMVSVFGASARTLRRHVRAAGGNLNRRISIEWTDKEEQQFVAAHTAGLTGAALQAAIPTRTLAGIKAHVAVMRGRGVWIR